MPVWEMEPFSPDDLLDHVARYLNPPVEAQAKAVRWRLANDARQSPTGLANAEWQLVINAHQKQSQAIPFTIADVELTLCSVGVGFVTLCVRSPRPEVATWMDLQHAFRFARGQRDVLVRATRPQAVDPGAPFFPAFAGGVDALDPAGFGTMSDVLNGLLQTASVKEDPGVWWDEVFVPGQLMTFAGLFVGGLDAEALGLLVYQVRNFFGFRQHLAPTTADL